MPMHLFGFEKMKPLLIVACLATVFSCNEKPTAQQAKQRNLLENFAFSMDTLMVDTGAELIDFGIPFIGAASADGRYYHILNYKSPKLQRIHLDSLKLINSYFFEKEGPNSPGLTFSFQPLGEGRFFFPSFRQPAIIHQSGEKVRSWDLKVEKITDGFPVESASVTNRIVFNSSLDQLYSLPLHYETREYYLAVLDSLGERKRMVALPEFQKANQFTIHTGGGDGGGLKIELPFLQHLNGKVLISCTVGNGIYIYNPILDCLVYREFPLTLLHLEKTGVVKNRVHSPEEFEEEIKKLATQISYWSFIWDEKSGLYFRFASRVLSHKTESADAELEIFLMAFTEELELIGETSVEDLSSLPKGGFFKGGKLWSHVNVADELGFAVMDFSYQ
ncbi:DUF4221 family protein [Cyclobacterium xiamenense]|uniref:DUF4221 family protein n=1 Tax=Cyclobacterium xiamenense TaxID=1297121 RepID=UPI0012B90698|nr:DUF4221 family protein [Cyclobacterium xiamenense]